MLTFNDECFPLVLHYPPRAPRCLRSQGHWFKGNTPKEKVDLGSFQALVKDKKLLSLRTRKNSSLFRPNCLWWEGTLEGNCIGFMAVITNHHTCNGLKHHKSIILQFCRCEVQYESHLAKIKVSAGLGPLEAFGENPSPRLRSLAHAKTGNSGLTPSHIILLMSSSTSLFCFKDLCEYTEATPHNQG